ncbi:MAG TPA: hypothetical protein PL182_10550 [Pseudobdellovibrionaceae bacterium]|nr:hypothetical protein [Pseudobdellovibrionaceae bacterium]
MKNISYRPMIAILLSISLSVPATARPSKRTTASKAAAVERFLNLVSQPEARTYRQMIQTLKPFVAADFLDHMEKKLASQLEMRFPKYELKDQGKTYLLILGSGTQSASLELLKKDPRVFARFRNQEILHSELSDAWKIMEKIEAGAKTPEEKAALFRLLIGEAHAFNWALFGGLGLLGAGIAAGLFFLSRSKIKTQHQVDVKVPEAMDVNVKVPTEYDINTNNSFSVPIIDKVLDGQK